MDEMELFTSSVMNWSLRYRLTALNGIVKTVRDQGLEV